MLKAICDLAQFIALNVLLPVISQDSYQLREPLKVYTIIMLVMDPPTPLLCVYVFFKWHIRCEQL